MKKISCRILPLSVFVIFSITQISLAADQDIQTKSEGWIASGKELLGPSWYQKNPKTFKTMPNSLLYHLTLDYSYSGQDGNVVTEKHNASAEMVLMKELVTSTTRYTVSRSEIEQALIGGATILESEKFFQAVRYPLTNWMQAVAGFTWRTRDTTKYLDDRRSVFGGALFDLIDQSNFLMTLGGFYSYSDVAYMNSKLTGMKKYNDFNPINNYSSDQIYLKQSLSWNITDTVTFTENAEYTQILKDTEYYFWLLKFGLDVKLTQNISFTASYTMDYEYNSFIEGVQNYLNKRRAVGEPTGNMEELDTTVSVGVKISF